MVGRRRARAFLCSSPVTPPASFLPRSGKGVAGHFLCPRSGTALADPRAVFSFPAACFVLNLLGWFCVLVSKICSVGVRCCSRRGRAAAPLPAGLVHRLPRLSPRPSRAAAIVRRGRAALRAAPPLRPLGIRARPPRTVLPPCLRGRPDDRCAVTGPPLRHFALLHCPVPTDLTAFGLPVLGRCGRFRDRINPRTLHSAASVWCSGPLADRRFALTALALRFIQPLARSRSDLASRGCTGSRADAQSAPRSHDNADAPLSCVVVDRLPPVTSFVGDRRPRAISFFSVAVTRPPLCSGRDTSPWFAP